MKGNTYTIAVTYSSPVPRKIFTQFKFGNSTIYQGVITDVPAGENRVENIQITIPNLDTINVGSLHNIIAYITPADVVIANSWSGQLDYIVKDGISVTNPITTPTEP